MAEGRQIIQLGDTAIEIPSGLDWTDDEGTLVAYLPKTDFAKLRFRSAVLLPMLLLVCWVKSAAALDRDGAIEAAKRQVKPKCTSEAPCKFTAKLEKDKWYVRVEFTPRNSPEEKAAPYRGGHAIFVINHAGKVVGRIEGK